MNSCRDTEDRGALGSSIRTREEPSSSRQTRADLRMSSVHCFPKEGLDLTLPRSWVAERRGAVIVTASRRHWEAAAPGTLPRVGALAGRLKGAAFRAAVEAQVGGRAPVDFTSECRQRGRVTLELSWVEGPRHFAVWFVQLGQRETGVIEVWSDVGAEASVEPTTFLAELVERASWG